MTLRRALLTVVAKGPFRQDYDRALRMLWKWLFTEERVALSRAYQRAIGGEGRSEHDRVASAIRARLEQVRAFAPAETRARARRERR